MGDRHNRHGPTRRGLLCPFRGGGGAGSPSNTMWHGHKQTSVPSFILIHPTVCPQYTNVSDRQTGQRSDSTGQTVLQTVVQKELYTTMQALLLLYTVSTKADMQKKTENDAALISLMCYCTRRLRILRCSARRYHEDYFRSSADFIRQLQW